MYEWIIHRKCGSVLIFMGYFFAIIMDKQLQTGEKLLHITRQKSMMHMHDIITIYMHCVFDTHHALSVVVVQGRGNLEFPESSQWVLRVRDPGARSWGFGRVSGHT